MVDQSEVKSSLRCKKKNAKNEIYEFSRGNQVDGSPRAFYIVTRSAVNSPCEEGHTKAKLKRKRAFSANQWFSISEIKIDENSYFSTPEFLNNRK